MEGDAGPQFEGYALVDSSGHVTASAHVAVAQPSGKAGVYCLTLSGIDALGAPPLPIVDSGTGDPGATVAINSKSPDCSGGFEVNTFGPANTSALPPTNPAPKNEAFILLVP